MSQYAIASNGIYLQGGPHCVLMLHGLGASSVELARMAKDLHQQGFTVVVPDITGYCFGTPGQAWEAWVSQAQNHLWELRKQYTTVSVVGVSMGATLAMVLAQRENIHALVLLSTALSYDGWAMPWYRFLLDWAPWLPFANRYTYEEEEPYGVKNEEMRAMVKRAMKSAHISESGSDILTMHYITEGRKLIKEALKHVPDVDAPVLFFHAVDDETVHIRNAEWAYRHVSSSQKDFIYLGDSYHMITVDNERETVSLETARFLKKTINEFLNEPAFEVPTVQSPELRRALRKRA
jgi:carboxylesterase